MNPINRFVTQQIRQGLTERIILSLRYLDNTLSEVFSTAEGTWNATKDWNPKSKLH